MTAMRVAALYDIHGNLPALTAVLAEVLEAGVDTLVVGGDVVPGPMPGECLSALADSGVPVRWIHGNGETDVLRVLGGEEPTRVPEPFRGMLRWVADRLSAEQAQAMAAWPLTDALAVDGLGEVLFCHATPRDDNEIFTRLTPEDRVAPAFAGVEADLVVCGHTHMQFDRAVGGRRIVNAGSVGMPFGEPGAYWLLLGPRVELRRTAYDRETAGTRIAATGYPRAPGFDMLRPPSEAEMLKLFEAAAIGGIEGR